MLTICSGTPLSFEDILYTVCSPLKASRWSWFSQPKHIGTRQVDQKTGSKPIDRYSTVNHNSLTPIILIGPLISTQNGVVATYLLNASGALLVALELA